MYLHSFVFVLSLVSFFSCLMTGNPCFDLEIIQKCNTSEILMPRKNRIGFPTFVDSLMNSTIHDEKHIQIKWPWRFFRRIKYSSAGKR